MHDFALVSIEPKLPFFDGILPFCKSCKLSYRLLVGSSTGTQAGTRLRLNIHLTYVHNHLLAYCLFSMFWSNKELCYVAIV